MADKDLEWGSSGNSGSVLSSYTLFFKGILAFGQSGDHP